MKRKWVRSLAAGAVFLLGVLLFVGAIAGVKMAQFRAMAAAGESMETPAESVSTFEVEAREWPRFLRTIGSIEPIRGVILQAEAPGVVRKIHFSNNQQVEAGELLVQLDVEVEKAQLRAAEASARLARTEFERAEALRRTDAVPASELDRAQANLDRALAEIENLQAVINRKTIRAPFDGTLGIRRINLGQYVSPGTPIVALDAYDQVYVNFSLPQQDLPRLRTGMSIQLTTDAFPGNSFPGELTAISPRVDPVTRSVELQGTLENPQGLLRAGLFARVQVNLPQVDEVLVIPASAIAFAPYGNSVYTVEQRTDEERARGRGVARQRFIRTGERRGDFVVVLDGLKHGDAVVSAGVFKLRNGSLVEIHNDDPPQPEMNPRPANT